MPLHVLQVVNTDVSSAVVIAMKTIAGSKAVEKDVLPGNENIPIDDGDDDVSDVEDEERASCCSRKILSFRSCLRSSVPTCFRDRCEAVIKLSLLVLYVIYFVFSMVLTFGDEGSIRLLACTVFGAAILASKVVRRNIIPRLDWTDRKWTFREKLLIAKARRIARWLVVLEIRLQCIFVLSNRSNISKCRDKLLCLDCMECKY